MLPGKTYGPEDFLRIAWKRKWLLVLPTLVIAAGTYMYADNLPNRYKSSTSILIVPQQVPEAYVSPAVTTPLQQRLQIISQQILSRTRLERVIEEFNLYSDERREMIMEDVVELMRKDVSLAVNTPRRGRNDASSFTIGFESTQPRTAMMVAERLASLFVQENLQDRELLADATNQFLQAQLEDARRRLEQNEQKLEEFRQRNSGRLPSQMTANLQMMQGAQSRLQSLADTSARDRDRLAMLETSIAEGSFAQPAPSMVQAGGATDSLTGTTPQQLESARTMLRSLELRLKPQHPDVVRLKRLIGDLEAKTADEALEAPLTRELAGAAPLPASASQGRLAAMLAEADQLRRRIESRKTEETRLNDLVGSYTQRVNAAPGLESELTELMRDYATIQGAYTTLLVKSEQSKMAANLERRQIGEQFKVLDGARLPERPISPDRVRLNLMGLAAGFGFGLFIIALLEYRDTTLKTDDDVVISLALPVLAVIPVMTTVIEREGMRKRRLVLALSASVASAVAVAVVVAWRLNLLDGLVR